MIIISNLHAHHESSSWLGQGNKVTIMFANSKLTVNHSRLSCNKQKIDKSQPKPLENKRKWAWLMYKQHITREVLNFNTRVTTRLLSYI